MFSENLGCRLGFSRGVFLSLNVKFGCSWTSQLSLGPYFQVSCKILGGHSLLWTLRGGKALTSPSWALQVVLPSDAWSCNCLTSRIDSYSSPARGLHKEDIFIHRKVYGAWWSLCLGKRQNKKIKKTLWIIVLISMFLAVLSGRCIMCLLSTIRALHLQTRLCVREQSL